MEMQEKEIEAEIQRTDTVTGSGRIINIEIDSYGITVMALMKYIDDESTASVQKVPGFTHLLK